ncbi:MAG TPA: APC family permease [Segeticoccus sp.]|nr:APC family permease [Segeticoccus sp.]
MASNVDAPVTHGVAGDDSRLKKDLGPVSLLFTAIGSIIGSGWLFSSLHAAEIAGPGAIISWVVGMIMFIFIGLSYSELGVMFPHSGGVARYPHYSFGSFASYSMGWVTWLACAAVAPVEVSAVLTYATNYLPWLENKDTTLTGGGIAVAVALMALFVVINYLGMKWFARINNVLVWWKIFMIILVIVAFIVVSFKASQVTGSGPGLGGFTPYGWHGVFSAIPAAAIAFSFFGFRQGIELAGETDNPKRNVPMTLIGSVVICGIFYILLQVAFLGATPTEAVTAGGWAKVGDNFTGDTGVLAQFGPLAAIAGVLGLTWLAVLLYADAIISPGDTGLIYTSVTARMSYAMGRNRNAPRSLSTVNDNGVPWISLLLAFVVGCIFFLPFPSWQKLVGIVTSMTVLSFGSGPIVLLVLRKQLPDQERPFRLAGAWVIASLALLSTNLIMYWAGWDQVWKMMLAIVLGYVLLAVFQALDKGHAPKLDFRHGWWVLVWFAGIALVSWLGGYPDASAGAGNLAVWGFNGGIVANVVLTIVVLVVAWNCQLPGERVREILSDSDNPESIAPAAAH